MKQSVALVLLYLAVHVLAQAEGENSRQSLEMEEDTGLCNLQLNADSRQSPKLGTRLDGKEEVFCPQDLCWDGSSRDPKDCSCPPEVLGYTWPADTEYTFDGTQDNQVDFDISQSMVRGSKLSDFPPYNSNGVHTMALEFAPAVNQPNTWANIFDIGNRPGGARFYLAYRTMDGKHELFWQPCSRCGGRSCSLPQDVIPGAYNCVVVTYDGSTSKVYLNGLLKCSEPTFEISDVKPVVGEWAGTVRYSHHDFLGSMKNLRRWDVVLNDVQIQDMCQARKDD